MGGANMSQQPQHAFGRVVPGGAAGAHMAHRANPYMNHPQQQQQATAGSISYLEYEVEASNDETMLPTMPRMDAPPANNRMNSPNRVSSPPNRTPSPQNPYMAQMQQQQQQQQQGYYQY